MANKNHYEEAKNEVFSYFNAFRAGDASDFIIF